MNRQQQIDNCDAILDRIHTWSRSESNRLRETILVPFFSGNACILHNSMIAYEQGRPWQEMGPREYKLARYYNWKQQQIWDTARRLEKHFYGKYIDACRSEAA